MMLTASTLLAGCAGVEPTQARRDVDGLLDERQGLAELIPEAQDEESRARVRQRVAELVAEPITLERALQIALLNNRELRAVLEDLGVAQADLVEAGLLENPMIAGDLVSSTAGNGLGGGLSLSQSLLSAFLIPAKRRIAKARLAYAVVMVGQHSLGLVRDVKVAYLDVQAALAGLQLQRTLAQTAEVGDELARRQHDAGNITMLDRQLFAAALDHARIELADAELEVTVAREQLTRLLGLWGKDSAWTLAAPMAELPEQEASLATLEQEGIANRLDLSAARFEVESMQYALELRRRGFVPQLEAGIEARNEVGNDAGHEWVLGPSLSLELPIFNPGHADFARLRAYLRQAQHRLEEASIGARSEIRVRREQLVAARRKVEYLRDTVLPRTQSIVKLTLEQYNAMLLGTYQLLETRADQLEERRHYVEALHDYWVARSELELATGGRLPQ